MPCTYTGSIEGDRSLSLRNELDKRERYLCAVMTQLAKENTEGWVKSFLLRAEDSAEGVESDEMSIWWKLHRRADKGVWE